MMATGSLTRGNSPASACDGKAAFATADKAHRTLQHKQKRHGVKPGGPGRGNVHVYRCNYCHQFHIGSTTL